MFAILINMLILCIIESNCTIYKDFTINKQQVVYFNQYNFMKFKCDEDCIMYQIPYEKQKENIQKSYVETYMIGPYDKKNQNLNLNQNIEELIIVSNVNIPLFLNNQEGEFNQYGNRHFEHKWKNVSKGKYNLLIYNTYPKLHKIHIKLKMKYQGYNSQSNDACYNTCNTKKCKFNKIDLDFWESFYTFPYFYKSPTKVVIEPIYKDINSLGKSISIQKDKMCDSEYFDKKLIGVCLILMIILGIILIIINYYFD